MAVPDDADVRLVGGRQLLGEAALQPQRRELRGELDDDHRISEAAEQLRAVEAAGDEQEGQPRRSRSRKPKKLVRPPLASAAISSSGAGGGRRSMRGAPVRPGADLDAERHAELDRRLGGASPSPARMTARGALDLVLGHFEHQLVMDLHQHPHAGRALGSASAGPIRDHRPLDDVGAGALDRRVDRGALGALALVLDVAT